MGRAASNSGSVHKRTRKGANGKVYEYWEARVTTGTDEATGKQKYRAFTAKTQSEALKKMQAAINDLNTNNYYEPKKITFGEWLDLWISEYSADKKPLTIKQYKSMINTHVRPALGRIKLMDINTVRLQSFYNQLMKKKIGGTWASEDAKTLSPKTIKNIHGIISKALNTAVKVGYIPNNPATNTTLPRVQKKEIHPLTNEQAKEFLSVAAEDEFYKLYKLILFTGMRESEAIGLTWDCVNFEDKTIKIYRQLQKRTVESGGYVFAPLKNSKTRVITIPNTVIKLLKDRQKEQIQEKFIAGEFWIGFDNEAERRTSLIFTKPDGEHLSTATVYNHYKKYAEQVGAPESRVHDLRHTFATFALQNGDSPKTVSEALGHATVAFTMDVYGHVSETMKTESADRMEKLIQSLIG